MRGGWRGRSHRHHGDRHRQDRQLPRDRATHPHLQKRPCAQPNPLAMPSSGPHEHPARPVSNTGLRSPASAPAGSVCPLRSGVRCVLSACRPEGSVDGPDVLGLSAGAASGGTSHAFKAVGERAGRRDGANVACRGTSMRAHE
ncbi:hypothetical protein SNL152K_2006 [Streptomyces sp. NL15-2K]|nr:hypothetical protein SNL152K_2006 [Streptomyces sp. NL15-2K]